MTLPSFERELEKEPLQEALNRIPVGIGILTGTWRHPIAFEQIQRQVSSSREQHFSGVSFFLLGYAVELLYARSAKATTAAF